MLKHLSLLKLFHLWEKQQLKVEEVETENSYDPWDTWEGTQWDGDNSAKNLFLNVCFWTCSIYHDYFIPKTILYFHYTHFFPV